MIDMDIIPLSSWAGVEGRPLIISGPCSAESEEQVMGAAKALKGQHIDILRAGIWKPRTRPNSFEGTAEVCNYHSWGQVSDQGWGAILKLYSIII